jgi:hypothetical protein
MDSRSLLSGMAIGAALTLVFTVRDVTDRARGLAFLARQRFSREEEIDDARLLTRVRAKIARVCSHPHAIHVYARDGEVTLLGPVLSHEVHPLLTAAASVRGVHAVVNDLEPHDSPDGIPALLIEEVRGGDRLARLRRQWTGRTGVLVGAAALAAGGLAVAYSRR